jgi:2-isopropylmalate synthase
LGEVTVQVRDNGFTFVGRGASTDVIEASARAYLQAINKMVQSRQRTA